MNDATSTSPATAAVDHLDALVGSWLTVPDVAERLGLDAAKVHRLLQERRLAGVRRGRPPVLGVPEAFLVAAHLANPANPAAPGPAEPTSARPQGEWAVLSALPGTLTLLADVGLDDPGAIGWLFTPDEALGRTPIEALRAGHKAAVRRQAQLLLQ